jgi:hypothetical protein
MGCPAMTIATAEWQAFTPLPHETTGRANPE